MSKGFSYREYELFRLQKQSTKFPEVFLIPDRKGSEKLCSKTLYRMSVSWNHLTFC